jgi:hypothetical protein
VFFSIAITKVTDIIRFLCIIIEKTPYSEYDFVYFFDLTNMHTNALSVNLFKKEYADSIQITLFHLQKDFYDYNQSVNNASNAYYDPFVTPERVRSNVHGGIGIFTFFTKDTKTIMR